MGVFFDLFGLMGVWWLGSYICKNLGSYLRQKKRYTKSHNALDLFLFQSYMHENASLLQVLEFEVGKEFEKKAFAKYKLPVCYTNPPT